MLAVRLNRPVSYVARDSLFRIPGIGWLLRRTYVTPISRDATRAATIRTTLSRLKEGFLVGMFPEGTRSSGTVKAFRPGFGAVLRRADVPVYPVGIAGADHVLPRGAWFIRPRRIIVVFGPPISIAELAEKRAVMSRDELVEFVRGRVAVAQEDALRRLEQRGGIVNE